MWFILNCQETSLKLTMDEKKNVFVFEYRVSQNIGNLSFFLRDA